MEMPFSKETAMAASRIVYIVLTCHTERQALFLLTADIKIEGRMRVIVILDITGTVIVAAAVTKVITLPFAASMISDSSRYRR